MMNATDEGIQNNLLTDMDKEEISAHIVKAREANPKLYVGTDAEVLKALLFNGGRIKIDEKSGSGCCAQWTEKAKEVRSLDDFNKLFNELVGDEKCLYEHDYGTICEVLACLAVAACRAADNTKAGGITGFQAGCIMWSFIQKWMRYEGPMHLVQWSDMLSPQHAKQFAPTISKSTHEWLVQEAEKRLENMLDAHPDIKQHWQFIAAGGVPFGHSVTKDDD